MKENLARESKVLVVDDELELVDELKNNLRDHFGEVDTATSAELATKLLHMKKYDVILTDLRAYPKTMDKGLI